MIEDAIRDESPAWVNANIDRETLRRLEALQGAPPEKIEERIDELAWEYDIGCAEALALSTLSLAGLALAKVHRGFLAIPALASGLLVWANLPVSAPSPLTPLFRAIGFRSRTEIERERHALKMMRGDYQRVVEDPTAKGAMTAAQAEKNIAGRSGKKKKGKKRMAGSLADDMPLGEELRPMDEPH